jgi:hypothetical protein
VRLLRITVLSALGLALAAPLAGQRVRFAPTIGLYIPTEQLYEVATGSQPDDFQLEAGPSFGARLGVWFGRRLGLELGGSYVPTTFLLGGSSPTKQDAKLFIGSGQLVLFLIPPTSPLSLFLSGGVATVSRGGVAFTNEATTKVGGVLGAGAGVNLGPLSLNVGADLLTYQADYRGSQAVSQELRQRDISLRLGFGIPFGGSIQR